MRRPYVRKLNRTIDLKCVDLDRPESAREHRPAHGGNGRLALIYAPLLLLAPLIASALVMFAD